MYRKFTLILLSLMAALVVLALPAAAAPASGAVETLTVEVAEDATRFVLDNLNPHDDGMPGYGSPFITQGYIYPAGTLNGTNGVLENGEPEFPELVLGEWTCYGWMINEGAYSTSGAGVVSTQIFRFYGEDGDATLVSNGFELVDVDVPVARVLSGGTGSYEGVTGTQVQRLMGMTDQMSVNLLVEFQFAQ